jgi:hypothetical protein
MTRAERSTLKHVRRIREELLDELTPRRTFDAMRQRVLKRLDLIEHAIVQANELEPTPEDRAFLARLRTAYVLQRVLEAEESAELDAPAPDEEGARTVNRSPSPTTIAEIQARVAIVKRVLTEIAAEHEEPHA